ncbi:translation initiation factor IF-3 [Nitzschia inconspicua]|uniref:Translation initiation factor IF-3 n=1 Tax=Nitzschia inconspicua TaxID=303405 RepID=A0A9K3KFP1_9STRA|nr:translation initiation factor IF-3 [Nitzschia inconspicua]KAG7342731.1 translation initiation factor IF-3 [Nitzschia inconspicua]
MVRPIQRLVIQRALSGWNSLPQNTPASNRRTFGLSCCHHPNFKSRQQRLESNKCISPIRLDLQARRLHCWTNQSVQGTSRIRSSSPYHQHDVSRSFASSRPRAPRKGSNKKNGSAKCVLSNEDLIAQLVRNANGASADNITVRLVIDEGTSEPPTVQVTSLTDAVKISLDRDADLILASLRSDPPVVRITELAKLQYKAEQAQKKQQQQSSSNKKEKKSFRFKAGIDTHDLERKVAQLTGFLQKGNECEYTVFTRARTLRENEDAGIELVDKIQALVAEYGVLKRAPETNETKNFYRVQLLPKKQ